MKHFQVLPHQSIMDPRVLGMAPDSHFPSEVHRRWVRVDPRPKIDSQGQMWILQVWFPLQQSPLCELYVCLFSLIMATL